MTARSQPAPRNYFGIPHGPVNRSVEPIYHDSLDTVELATGAVALEIETLAPVHVGSGAFELSGDRICKEPVRRGGVLVIPATSIKGMSRQVLEAISASGSPFDRAEHHKAVRRGPGSGLSPAAAVFGTLGLQGRVGFDDAVPAPDGQPAEIAPESILLSVAYPPQKPVGRRFYGPMPDGADQPASVPALAIPAGTVLRTRMRFRNATRAALGGVLISLGVGRFTPRLGGGKYDDHGWVRFRVTGYRFRPPGTVSAGRWEREPDAVAAFVGECQEQVPLTGAGKEALARLTRKLQWQGTGSVGKGTP